MIKKTLDDLHPDSIRRLANILSYSVQFRTSEEGLNLLKHPLKWIKDRLSGASEFSNLMLNDFSAHDDEDLHGAYESNVVRDYVFEMSENIRYDDETAMPENGKFIGVVDLGKVDAVRIEAWAHTGSSMIVKSIECFDAAYFDEAVKSASKARFATFLEIAMALAEHGSAPLSSEEVLDVINQVVSEHPALEAARQARKMQESLSERGSRPSSISRRSM